MKARQTTHTHAARLSARETPGSGTTDRALQQRIKPLPSDPNASVSSFDRPPAGSQEAAG